MNQNNMMHCGICNKHKPNCKAFTYTPMFGHGSKCVLACKQCRKSNTGSRIDLDLDLDIDNILNTLMRK